MNNENGSDITPDTMVGFVEDVLELVRRRGFKTEDLVYANGMITCALAQHTGDAGAFYRLVINLLEGALQDELRDTGQEPEDEP